MQNSVVHHEIGRQRGSKTDEGALIVLVVFYLLAKITQTKTSDRSSHLVRTRLSINEDPVVSVLVDFNNPGHTGFQGNEEVK